MDEYIVKNVKRAVATTKVITQYKTYILKKNHRKDYKMLFLQCIFGTMYPSQFSQSESSDEANNLMFSTYRFKLFLITDS